MIQLRYACTSLIAKRQYVHVPVLREDIPGVKSHETLQSHSKFSQNVLVFCLQPVGPLWLWVGGQRVVVSPRDHTDLVIDWSPH